MGLPTVDVSPPAWQRLVFAPFWFNHHGAHHLFMAVPHYNLPALVELSVSTSRQAGQFLALPRSARS